MAYKLCKLCVYIYKYIPVIYLHTYIYIYISLKYHQCHTQISIYQPVCLEILFCFFSIDYLHVVMMTMDSQLYRCGVTALMSYPELHTSSWQIDLNSDYVHHERDT